MKVLLVHDYGAPTGGAETQMLGIRDSLRAAGHEVRVLTSTALLAGGEIEAERTAFGTTRNRLQVLSRTVNPSAYRALRDELRSFRPDVVHLRMFLAQLSPTILALLSDVPTIHQVAWYKAICPTGKKMLPTGELCGFRAGRACSDQGCVTPQTLALDMAQMSILRHYRSSIDAVVALSEVQANQLRNDGYTGPDGTIHVIPNAINVPHGEPEPSSRPTVGFAGRLVREKGVHVLLEAMPAVLAAMPGTELVIAGNGPELATLRMHAEELGIDKYVRFTGHLERDEVEALLETAWVQAVPGLWEEPFGNVVTEAMARGTALVATNLGGPGEIIDDGETGLLIGANDADSLADALVKVLSDDQFRNALVDRARAVARTRYHPDRLLSQLTELYEELQPGTAIRAARAKELR